MEPTRRALALMHGHPKVPGWLLNTSQPRRPYAQGPRAGLIGTVQQVQPLAQACFGHAEGRGIAGLVTKSQRNDAITWRDVHKGWQQLPAGRRSNHRSRRLDRFTSSLLGEFLAQLDVGIGWRWRRDRSDRRRERLQPLQQYRHQETQHPAGQPDNNCLPSRQCTREPDAVFFDIKLRSDPLNCIVRCHDALPKFETGQLVYPTLSTGEIPDEKKPRHRSDGVFQLSVQAHPCGKACLRRDYTRAAVPKSELKLRLSPLMPVSLTIRSVPLAKVSLVLFRSLSTTT